MGAARRSWVWGAAAVLLAAFALQSLFSINRLSATSDEVPHLAAGYSYLETGDFRLNYEHPPLVKTVAALPLLALHPDFNRGDPTWVRADEWAFGERFINDNRVPAKRIVFWGRLPMVALAVLLGLLVFLWAREIYGGPAALVSLALFAFSPNMLANAPLVTFDVPNALFALLSVYTFYHFLLAPDRRHAIYAGLALGLALASKTTALLLVPLYVLLWIAWVLGRREKTASPTASLRYLWPMPVAAGLVVLVSYHVTAIADYAKCVGYFAGDVGRGGRPAFLLGKYSLKGWWYYFLAAMAIKTPIPTLALFAAAGAVVVRRRRLALAELFLLIPAGFFLIASSASRLQLGIRYVLHVYPFLFVFAGAIAAWIGGSWRTGLSTKRIAVAAVGLLLIWLAVGTLRISPHYLAYFNETVGGPKNGYKCLLDSNLDWGQDLPALTDFLKKEGNPEVILSFFGTASPRTYGITYQDFYSYNSSGRREDHIDSLEPKREIFVISANLLQSLFYPDKSRYDWLKQRLPVATLGYSLFVYDVTRDADAQVRLGVMYMNGGLLAKAERQMRRALAIDPTNARAKGYLDIILGKS